VTAAHGRVAGLRPLSVVLAISIAVFVVEAVGALVANSLALLADAGHVLADVVGMALSVFAIWLGSRPANEERTFGHLRAEILAAVVNATILFGIAFFLLVEAGARFADPPAVASTAMLSFAVLGLAANLVSAWILHRSPSRTLNLRAASLEVLSDAAGSAIVIVAAIIIAATGLHAVDAIASAAVALLILPRTWRLLREAIDVLLEATPRDVDTRHVRRHILDAPGVIEVHDLHIWTITSGMNVISAHVVLSDDASPPLVLRALAACLRDDFDIEHSTFQLETAEHLRIEEGVHP
jgi:cobalt-zinc-cadmium efflux system protein